MQETTTATPWNEELARSVISRHAAQEGSLLVVLQALQETFGYLPEGAVPLVANALNLSRAEVHGVATFYHDLRHAPCGRHVLKMCRAEACQSMGGEALAQYASRSLGVAFGETAADASLTLAAVYCLGLCACAPAAMYDDRPVGRLSEATVAELLAESRT